VLNYKIEKKRNNSGSKSIGNKYILKEKKKKKRESNDPMERKEFNTNICYIFICALLIYCIAIRLFVRVFALSPLTLFGNLIIF